MVEQYTIKRATLADLPTIADICIRAMSSDVLMTQMCLTLSFEEQKEWFIQNWSCRFDPGEKLEVCETWMVVDGTGKIVAFSGIGLPNSLSPEDYTACTPKWEFPATRNEALYQAWSGIIGENLVKHKFDYTTQFLRQTSMVHPDYQRRGLGSMLTHHLNSLADDVDRFPTSTGETYIRARPTAAGMLYKVGFDVVHRVDFDLKDYGGDGITAMFFLTRKRGAANDPTRKLDTSGLVS